MMEMYRLVVAIVLALALQGPCLSKAAEEKIVLVMPGIGYSFVGNSNILESQLKRWKTNIAPIRDIPSLPSACFRKPGITSISDINAEEGRVRRLLELLSMADIQPILKCGEQRVKVNVFFEGKTNKGNWFIVNNPTDSFYNTYAVEWILKRNKRFDRPPFKKHERGEAIEYFSREDKRGFAFWVLKEKYGVVFDLENKRHKEDFDELLVLLGFKVYPANTKEHPFRSAIFLGDANVEMFFPSLRKAVFNALELSVAAQEVSIKRMEFGFGDRYDPNWLKNIANEVRRRLH